MQNDRALVSIREKLDDVLDEIPHEQHRTVIYLAIACQMQSVEISRRMGHGDAWASRIISSKRYRDVVKRARRAYTHAFVDTDPEYMRRARELRDRHAIPALEDALVNGSAREKVNAVRHLDEVTGMSKREIHISGSVDHRHMLESPEFRDFRKKLADGRVRIVDDAPPPDTVQDAEFEEIANDAD